MRARKPQSAWALEPRGLVLARMVLRVAELARAPLTRLGVEMESFRALVTVRFLLDHRGSFVGMEGQAQVGFVLLLSMTWLSGIGVGVAGIGKLAPIAGATWIGIVGVHAFLTSIVVMTLQLGSLLVDGSDAAPIRARPIGDRTLLAMRIAHVGGYVGAIASTCAFWPMLLGWIGQPWWAVLLLVPVAVAVGTATAVALAAAGFAALLAVFGPRRFQRAALWGQVLGGVVLFGGLQMIAPLLSAQPQGPIASFVKSAVPWVPPFSVGALHDVVAGSAAPLAAARAFVGLGTPIVLVVLAFALAGDFARTLAGDVTTGTARVRWPRAPIGARLCRSREELAGWGLATALSLRDKVFVRVMAPIATVVVVSLAGGLAMGFQAPPMLAALGVLPLHMLGLLPVSIVEAVGSTEQADARTALDHLPIVRRTHVLRGAVRAVVARIVAPLHVGSGVVVCAILGPRAIPHAAIAVLASFAVGLSAVPAMRLRMPFSWLPRPGEMSMHNVPPVFGTIGLAFVAAGLHFAASLHWLSTGAALALAALAALLVWRRLEKIQPPLPM